MEHSTNHHAVTRIIRGNKPADRCSTDDRPTRIYRPDSHPAPEPAPTKIIHKDRPAGSK